MSDKNGLKMTEFFWIQRFSSNKMKESFFDSMFACPHSLFSHFLIISLSLFLWTNYSSFVDEYVYLQPTYLRLPSNIHKPTKIIRARATNFVEHEKFVGNFLARICAIYLYTEMLCWALALQVSVKNFKSLSNSKNFIN